MGKEAVIANSTLPVGRPHSLISGHVMPLSMVRNGENVRIKSVTGKHRSGEIMRRLLLILLVPLILALAGPTPVSAAVSWDKVVDKIEFALNQSLDAYKSGDVEKAKKLVNDAYYGIYEKEGLEIAIKSKISGRRGSTEEYAYSTIKKLMTKRAPASQLQQEINALIKMMREDAVKLGGNKQQSPMEMFLVALLMVVREGFAAVLVIGATIAYLIKSGNGSQTHRVYYSSVAAIGVSFLTAVLLQKFFGSNSANQRLLEGATMLLAMAILFSASCWMLNTAKAKSLADPNYSEGEVQASSGSVPALTLGLAAFLAVYGKGPGTVFLYQTLFSDADGQGGIIWGGFGAGCLVLVGIFLLVRYVSMKMSLKPFGRGTSILIYLLAIRFAGSGVQGLQEAGSVDATSAPAIPTIEILGIYPTWETLLPQLALILLAVGGVIYRQRKPNSHITKQS